jgi:hypothetical protein
LGRLAIAIRLAIKLESALTALRKLAEAPSCSFKLMQHYISTNI